MYMLNPQTTWPMSRAISHSLTHVSAAGRRTSSPAAGAASAAAADLSEARLAGLDDAIRDALRSKRSVYEDSKALLLRLFK